MKKVTLAVTTLSSLVSAGLGYRAESGDVPLQASTLTWAAPVAES